MERSKELDEYQKEVIRRALRPGSIDKRMSVLTRAETAIGKPLAEATTADLRGWLDAKTLHARTRYSYISHLATFWRWALAEQLVTTDPTLRLTRPKVRPGLPRPIATDDLTSLIELAPTPMLRAMLYLGGYAGLRCMEMAGLDGPEVMDHRKPPVLVVAHGKGDRARVVPIGPQLIEALRAHGIPRVGPLFRSASGVRLKPWQVSHMLRDHMHDCGIDSSAHQLRHAYATAVYARSGGDLRMTQELLGHSSPSTTAIYAAWDPAKAAVVTDDLYGDDEPNVA